MTPLLAHNTDMLLETSPAHAGEQLVRARHVNVALDSCWYIYTLIPGISSCMLCACSDIGFLPPVGSQGQKMQLTYSWTSILQQAYLFINLNHCLIQHVLKLDL